MAAVRPNKAKVLATRVPQDPFRLLMRVITLASGWGVRAGASGGGGGGGDWTTVVVVEGLPKNPPPRWCRLALRSVGRVLEAAEQRRHRRRRRKTGLAAPSRRPRMVSLATESYPVVKGCGLCVWSVWVIERRKKGTRARTGEFAASPSSPPSPLSKP